MSFLSISYVNFRNLKDATHNIGYPEVFLVGKNGQGKTSFLEALYVSSYGASFKSVNEGQVFKKGTNSYSVSSLYKESEDVSHTIFVGYSKGKKELQKDMKKVERKELIKTIPCILFYISDIEFVVGSQARRRFFFDQCLSMYDISYLHLLNSYLKILMAKNAVIRSQQNLELLETYNVQISVLAFSIAKKRFQLIEEFNQEFSSIYQKISGISNVNINYQSTVPFHTEDELFQALQQKRNLEIRMGVSVIGPHRDKINFVKENVLFEKEASNGQRRLLSLVLRILQAKFYTFKLKSKPVLLMDDVMLELDPEKKQKVMSLLPPYKQLFCTFLNGEIFNDYKTDNTKIFSVEDGVLSERN